MMTPRRVYYVMVLAVCALGQGLTANPIDDDCAPKFCPAPTDCKTMTCSDDMKLCTKEDTVFPEFDTCKCECGTGKCAVQTCLPKEDRVTESGHWCQDHCPTPDCLADEKRCEGGYDSNGCQYPAECIKVNECNPDPECKKSEYDNNGCPIPEPCATDERECIPSKPEKEHCQKENYKTCKKMIDEVSGCPNLCDIDCAAIGQTQCEDYDEQGCLALTCQESPECPAKTRDSRGCPVVLKPQNCAFFCPKGVSDKGCHLGWTCKPEGEDCDWNALLENLPQPAWRWENSETNQVFY